ncbi:hypothetical protein J7K03_02760 [bacterium]|nr:hypothetical protein [bacterium]
MNKKILISLSIIGIVAAIAVGGTVAYFSDTETSTGNTFSAGSLDLKVKDGDNPGVLFTLSNITPGQYYDAGTVTLKNAGSIPGRLSIKIKDPVSNENSLEEPEIEAGDAPDTEVDPGSYDANEGDGELWDLCFMRVYVDGNHDGKYTSGSDGDCIIEQNALDKTDYYHFPIDEDLFPIETNYYCHDEYIDLDSDETVDIGVQIYFYSDDGGGPEGGWSSQLPPDETGMSDDLQFTIEFGLNQIQ